MLVIGNEELISQKLLPLVRDFQKKFVSEHDVIARGALSGTLVKFHDSREKSIYRDNANNREVDSLAGMLSFNHSSGKYVITSRKIKNDKYYEWRNEYKQVTTKDPKKALKLMFQHIKPFTIDEIVHAGKDRANIKHETWVQDAAREFRSLSDQVSDAEIVQEITSLVAQGIKFKTNTFRLLAEVGIAAYKEQERRRSSGGFSRAVVVNAVNGVVMYGGFKGAEAGDWKSAPGIELLPPEWLEPVSMLKIVTPGTFVPEVGVRMNESMYYLY